MNIEDLDALTQEIRSLKRANLHVQLMQRMDQYEGETSDPVVLAVLLIAKAVAALNLGDVSAADDALSRIDPSLPDGAVRNYVTLTKASAAHQGGRFSEADRFLSAVTALPLASPYKMRNNATLYMRRWRKKTLFKLT